MLCVHTRQSCLMVNRSAHAVRAGRGRERRRARRTNTPSTHVRTLAFQNGSDQRSLEPPLVGSRSCPTFAKRFGPGFARIASKRFGGVITPVTDDRRSWTGSDRPRANYPHDPWGYLTYLKFFFFLKRDFRQNCIPPSRSWGQLFFVFFVFFV